MTGDYTTDLLTAAERTLASIPLPPVVNELPHGARPIQWTELDGAPATTLHADDADTLPNEMLDLRIELGRARICRDEAKRLRAGALLSLDNAAGDPVDLYAGGHLIARGEVLVLDGVLGVRVVDVLS
jgi:flagellar motor switch protein FliN